MVGYRSVQHSPTFDLKKASWDRKKIRIWNPTIFSFSSLLHSECTSPSLLDRWWPKRSLSASFQFHLWFFSDGSFWMYFWICDTCWSPWKFLDISEFSKKWSSYYTTTVIPEYRWWEIKSKSNCCEWKFWIKLLESGNTSVIHIRYCMLARLIIVLIQY